MTGDSRRSRQDRKGNVRASMIAMLGVTTMEVVREVRVGLKEEDLEMSSQGARMVLMSSLTWHQTP